MILQIGGAANLITGIKTIAKPAKAESAGFNVDEEESKGKLEIWYYDVKVNILWQPEGN